MTWIDFLTKTLPAIALLGGGFWAVINWVIAERRRRAREISSLDGSIASSLLWLDDGRAVATIIMIWRNAGTYPVSIDPEKTHVDIFECKNLPAFGVLDVDTGLGSPVAQAFPLADAAAYILEPGTNSEVRCHVVVKQGELYFVRWELLEASKGEKTDAYAWSREAWLDARVKP